MAAHSQRAPATAITTLFVDIGGVLLSNGWDHHARRRAATHFDLDWAAMEQRHGLNCATHEEGKLTLAEYLARVVFYQPRSFTPATFVRFMRAQSTAAPDMLAMIAQLRLCYRLKIVVVSNEGRELNAYRVRKFKLGLLVDAFISSSFIHLRKPDVDIFRLALDVAQAEPEQVVYIDNTAMFVDIAASLGVAGILHTDFRTTRAQLAGFGLQHVL